MKKIQARAKVESRKHLSRNSRVFKSPHVERDLEKGQTLAETNKTTSCRRKRGADGKKWCHGSGPRLGRAGLMHHSESVQVPSSVHSQADQWLPEEEGIGKKKKKKRTFSDASTKGAGAK